MSIENEIYGPEKQSSAPAQGSLFVVMPQDRQEGWAVYRNRVIFIIRDPAGKFRVRTGFICSTPNTHAGIDNVTNVMVWSDTTLRRADCADDAHEKSFKISDPMLIKLEDVYTLRDGRLLKKWFKGVLSPHEITQIQRLLKLSDFGRGNELVEIAQAERPQRLLRELHNFWRQHISPFVPLPPRPSKYWGGYRPDQV